MTPEAVSGARMHAAYYRLVYIVIFRRMPQYDQRFKIGALRLHFIKSTVGSHEIEQAGQVGSWEGRFPGTVVDIPLRRRTKFTTNWISSTSRPAWKVTKL